MLGLTGNPTVDPRDPQGTIWLGVTQYRGVDEDSAATNSVRGVVGLLRRIWARGGEHEHQAVLRRIGEVPFDLCRGVAHRLSEGPSGRGAVDGVAGGAVLGRVLPRLGEICRAADQQREDQDDHPPAHVPHAACSWIRCLNGAAACSARAYVSASTSLPPYTAASNGRSSGRSRAGSLACWKISRTVSGLPSHVCSPASVAATPAHNARIAPTRLPAAAMRSASAK